MKAAFDIASIIHRKKCCGITANSSGGGGTSTKKQHLWVLNYIFDLVTRTHPFVPGYYLTKYDFYYISTPQTLQNCNNHLFLSQIDIPTMLRYFWNYLIRTNFGEHLIWRRPFSIKFGVHLIWR